MKTVIQEKNMKLIIKLLHYNIIPYDFDESFENGDYYKDINTLKNIIENYDDYIVHLDYCRVCE